jgi:hypothetical protein
MMDDTGQSNNSNGTDKCRYCKKVIISGAKVCQYCSRHQNRFWQHFRIEQIGLLISLVLLILAISQTKEALKERILASDAMSIADTTKLDVEKRAK